MLAGCYELLALLLLLLLGSDANFCDVQAALVRLQCSYCATDAMNQLDRYWGGPATAGQHTLHQDAAMSTAPCLPAEKCNDLRHSMQHLQVYILASQAWTPTDVKVVTHTCRQMDQQFVAWTAAWQTLRAC